MQRVVAFGVQYRRSLAGGTAGARLFATLDEHVRAIQHEVDEQAEGRLRAGENTCTRAEARAALLAQLAAISATARALTKRRGDVAEHFRRLRRPRDYELLKVARSMAEAIAPNQAAFVDHHMSPTFLADLRAAIAAFERVQTARVDSRTRHVSATLNIRRALACAAETIRGLDAAVLNVFHANPLAMNAWQRARRVHGVPGRRKRRTPPPRER